MSTVSDLLGRIMTKLSLMGGLDVQVYGQPKIMELLQSTFNDVFDRRFWNCHMAFIMCNLDGTTGLVTGDLSSKLKSFNDIRNLWVPSQTSPLPRGPRDVTPSRVNMLCYVPEADTQKVFRVLPMYTNGTIDISYRARPARLAEASVVPFDDEYLIFEVCAQYMNLEGANTSAAKDFRDKADKRLAHLMWLESNGEFSMYGADTATQDQWRDA